MPTPSAVQPSPLHPRHSEAVRVLKQHYSAVAGQCYRNAFDALLPVSSVLGGGSNDVYYVEGWVALADFPTLTNTHGWLEHEGQVIDPTYQDRATQCAYFPVMHYTLDELMTLLQETPKFPLFAHDGAEGWTNLKFACAYLAAQRWGIREWGESERIRYEQIALGRVLGLIERLERGEGLEVSERRFWLRITR